MQLLPLHSAVEDPACSADVKINGSVTLSMGAPNAAAVLDGL